MDKERWQEISGVLDEVLTIDESKQLTYLEQHYGEDEALVEEVRELLFSITESRKSSFLESARKDSKKLIEDIKLPPRFEGLSDESLVGQSVGPYKITELLAKGGMGSVFKADRADGQFEQSVAVKFINRQSLSELTYSRFRREQKILANLNHPNIATLLDGGITESGFPYLIMEYVEGTRIDEYCNEKQLNLKMRIELVKKILNAIDYAHSNLVIHRDLKPGNILVTESGEVKILDFGIAALISDEDSSEEPLTKTGQRLWTPQYAAPEQVLEKPPLLQTDIYSLGGLIYKLLSGETLFQFKNRSVHEIEKMILEENPPLMSRVAGRTDPASVSKQFGMKKKELVKELSNDLDAIVAKCIRKEPEYRYSSVSLLLDDIVRYQNNMPVTAKSGGFRYRAWKYFKRNSQPILTAALLLIGIASTVAYYTMQVNQQRILAEREAEKSQQMTDFMVGIFESANAHYQDGTQMGLDASIGSILDMSISKMDEDLADQPMIKASLKTTLGKMYLRLGEFERAEALTTDAIESLSVLDSDTREELASAVYELARVHQETGNTQMADSLLLQAIDIHRSTERGLIDEQALAAVSMYANLQWFNNGDFYTADSLLSQNLEIRYEHYSDKEENLAVGHNDLAAMNHSRGSFRAASEHYQKAIDLYRSSLGDHPALGVAMGNYSILLREYNRLDEAEEFQREALQIHINTTGEKTIDTGLGNGNMGEIMFLKGDLETAEPYNTKALEILKSIYGDVHPFVCRTNLLKGRIMIERELFAEAEELIESEKEHYANFYPADHGRQSDPLRYLGELYLAMDNPAMAESRLSEAYEVSIKGYGEDNWRTAVVMNSLAEALIQIDRNEEAFELLEKSSVILESEFGENDHRTINAYRMLRSLQQV